MMTVAGKEVVHTREVTCGEAEDHPLVYYVIGKSNEVTCGYCNRPLSMFKLSQKRRKKSKKNFLL